LKVRQPILFFVVALILFSCAQIVPLTGGDQDLSPPKEVESLPKNGATYFADKTITIEFDEYIQLTNLSSQLIISPLMETAPEVSIKGKKLLIKLNSELEENTTYSFNFGNAITDITENNIAPNFKYVFSTGSFIDSLSYSGIVVNAFDLKKKEKIYVLLYDQFEDSIPLKEKPRYIAISDKEGNFSITNIAEGTYKVFAIKDINSNYLFDLPNEEIGFKTDFIDLKQASDSNIIYLFEEENNIQYVVKTEHKKYGEIDLILNTPTKALSLTPLNKTYNEAVENWSFIESNKIGDSLKIWLVKDINIDKIELELKDGEKVIDTVDIALIDQKKFKDSLAIITTNVAGNFDLNQNIMLTLNRPFVSYNADSIKLYEDSVLVTTIFFSVIGLRQFELAYDFKEKTNYQLQIPPGAFEDMYGLKNDSLIMEFNTKELADYGTILLSVNPNFTDNYILELYQNNKLVKAATYKGEQKINYSYLAPGAYQLKLIIDNNSDKKWTTGNYLNGKQPEKVIFYEKEITIRANWDNEINWVIKE
jgi:uncharacterized protein (DUF2141 family)